MRANLKIILFIIFLITNAPVSAGLGLGMNFGFMGFSFQPHKSKRPAAPPREEKPTGIVNAFYLRGNVGRRLISNSDAYPYYDYGSFFLPPDLTTELGNLGGLAVGFMWRKGVSFELGLELGPRRSVIGDVVHQNGQIPYEDVSVSMKTRTTYAQVGMNWLIPLFPPKQYLLLGLGGRAGVATLQGVVSSRQNFPSGPGIPFEGGHDIVSITFSQGLAGRASWLVTPWLSLDLEAIYESIVFTRIEIRNGRGYLEGIEESVPFDVTPMGGPMIWNYSGPSFRAGLTFYFKTPVAALRAVKRVRQVSEEDKQLAEEQRLSADALLKASLLPEALDSYKTALKKDPGNARAWYGLGTVHYRSKEFDKSLKAFEKALELEPENKTMASYINRLKTWMMKKKGLLN